VNKLLARPWATAALGSAIFAVVVAFQISIRTPLSLDELHTALLARALANGESVSFYVGSVSRYEGGSWLIAWPVAGLMKIGAWGTAATSWTAALISIATVFLMSLWVGREVRPSAGLGLGPLAAAAAPELVHYSYRAWGSLSEALLFLPLLALAYSAWVDRGRRLPSAPLLGLLLGVSVIFSYLHMLTALVFVAVQGLDARREHRMRRAALETVLVGVTALAVFGLWLATVVPFASEALSIRDGRPLTSLVGSFLLVRMDLVLTHLPQAWAGAITEMTPLRLAAGIALTVLTIVSAVAVSQQPGRARWGVVFLLACIPAVSVGHTLAPLPMSIRYYLPLLAAAVVVIASWDGRAVAAAMVLGLAFWLPHGLEMPGQWPWRSYTELGANALHRYTADPHVKFRLFRKQTPPELRPSLAFGYGLDTGTRFGPHWSGLQTVPFSPPETDAHFYLYEARAWLDLWDEGAGRDRDAFFRGVGVGLVSNGTVDGHEAALLEVVGPQERQLIFEGIGAGGVRLLELGQPLHEALAAVQTDLTGLDWEALGTGMGRGRSHDEAPPGWDFGLDPDSPELTRLQIGQETSPDPVLVSMLGLPIVPTPKPPELD
jgi:hypothetical protein